MNFIELVIDEEAELYGIDAISLVEQPAIESDFIAMNAQLLQFKTQDEEKRIVMGAALIPDKPIYRKSGDEEYYVYFSKKTVRRAMELYLKNGNQANATLEHEHKINGLHVVESWIVEGEQDKSRMYGLEVPVGTWMVSMKVENDAIWEKFVKEGSVKGFSIEGYFANKYDLSRAIVKEDKRFKDGKRVVMESYSDYPDAVKNNAKRGIELNEKEGNKCATQTGKVRAQQLANGEPVSEETIKRMYSYLSRAEEYYNPSDTSACGTISYLLWGGKAGLRWAKSKLSELELLSAIEIELGLEHLEELLLEYMVSQVISEEHAIINDRLAYSTEEAARKAAEDMGLEGIHTHELDGKTWYMPGATHQLAEVGPRGGIRRSRKAPKSDTPNRNPKGKGTAKGDASDTRSAKVSKKDEATLKKKSDEFNERYKEKLGYGVNVGMLKAVFQRGLGAFNVSHSPKIKSASAWAFARVNAFLYLVKNGRPQNKKYTGDNDLLPKEHPKRNKE